MKIKRVIILTACILALAAGVLAQKKPVVKFTFVYTNLIRNCKTLRASHGSDEGSLCRGAGNYQVRIYFSAAAAHVRAEIRGKDESVMLAMLGMDFDERKVTLEWRLADGKPFAVIMRVPIYGEPSRDPAGSSDPYFGKVTGQQLVVNGLFGFEETVKGEVDAKTPNANAKARELADKAYAEAAK
jgi:hypothetical protein